MCMNFIRRTNSERTGLEYALFEHLQDDILQQAYESSVEVIEIAYALSIAPWAGDWTSIEWAIPVQYGKIS